ncbi:MAG TPA: DEAD/DEAH box helicase, partial [Polyangiales bacterium]
LDPTELLRQASSYTGRGTGQLLLDVLGFHPPAALLQRLGLPLTESYLQRAFEVSMLRLTPIGDGALQLANDARQLLGAEPLALAAAYLALRGEPDAAASLLERPEPSLLAARCLVALTRGRFEDARSAAASAIEATRTKKSNRLKGMRSWLAEWTTLVLLTDQDPRAVALARAQLETIKRAQPECEDLHALLEQLSQLLLLGTHSHVRLRNYQHREWRWDELLFLRTLAQAADEPMPSELVNQLASDAESARAAGFRWLAAELASAQAHQGLDQLYRSEEPWQRALRALEAAIDSVQLQAAPASAPRSPTERLVWTLTPDARGGHQVTARVQSGLTSGWSAGRQISWKKLAEARDAAWLAPEDLPVLKHIDPPDRYQRMSHLPDAELPVALIGHSRVFLDPECKRPVEVVRGSVRLEVKSEDEQLVIALAPRACHALPVVCEYDGHARVLVYALSSAQFQIAERLGRTGLSLPSQALSAAERAIARLVAHFPVDSEFGIEGVQLEQESADPRVHISLTRTSAGLRLRLFTAPIGPSQTFVPGAGSASVLGTRETEQGVRSVRALRDLSDERQRLTRLLDECPSLAPDAVREQRIDDLERCLELLSELRAATDVVLLWAEGGRLALAGERGVGDLRVTLRSVESWLTAEGELEVDALTRLQLRALLDARQRRGRFIPLDDGRYLALTMELARTLDLLAPLAQPHADELRLHPLSLLQLAALDADQLRGDTHVEDMLARVRAAEAHTPEVHATFQATLRPYQEEGYVWLSRLSHWGGGACLADDMGLGKTLQALALLVEHAPRGPALVVAPTSVCANWVSEARKFAPTLRVVQLSGERAKLLRELTAYDVLICSYGLLQQESERLSQVRFHVAILDEAQAIKNPAALRTKAALALNAEVRVALTGTPVENHLGDLYSLMRFLNPGLLGSAQQFEARFAKPMQRDGDRAAGQLLKRLIKPFLLRRKKSEVLDDLPPKTVVTLRVEPSDDERALYGALREQALERLAAQGPAAQARMRVLAELTRLRRAACHPSLVLGDAAPAGSKLAAFLELVDELREGGHRALVFSQFVDHLTIVRTQLNERGIPYQYLDGSTPPQARSEAVEAFRAGQGDLFLISLKAGGFGLNLTAADYVVHLDPWWNPAVEDQASDRAHRIGQTRPVTVY